MESPRWVERYRGGEREQVWHELRQLGAAVRKGAVRDEAQLVCDEMARRARHNVETIVERLRLQGFRFHTNDDAARPVDPFLPASDQASAQLNRLTALTGPLPLTVAAWLRLVGDVWWVGTHPDWPEASEADPFVLELEGRRWPSAPLIDFFAGELDEWTEAAAEDPAAGGFVLPVAPDRLHKANISGGAPYGFRLPDACADAVFVGEVAMPFVDYLNLVFAHGGFPGPAAGAKKWRVKQALAKDLLPL